MFAIFASAGTSVNPYTLSPNSLRSFSLNSRIFSTYLVRRNLSPLLKLLSNPIVNFFNILPPPPITPLVSGPSFASLVLISPKSLLFLRAGTLFSNYSIYLLSTCSQYRRMIRMSCTLSCSFSLLYNSPATSFLSSELSTLFR
jgi:hypothetical protein